MPTTLDWYMKHVFPMQRGIFKAVRPIANRLSPVDLPADSYFANIRDLYEKIEGIGTLLEDPKLSSVRLVTNPEKMVVRETQRAFVYFSLHGLTVDNIIVNRVLPSKVEDNFFTDWRQTQQHFLAEVERYFAPVPMRQVELFPHEILGLDRIREFGNKLYPDGFDPAAIVRTERPFEFLKQGDTYEVRMQLPFTEKAEVGLFKKGDELVVEIGTLRRHVGLPTSMVNLNPVRARLENRMLVIEMKESV